MSLEIVELKNNILIDVKYNEVKKKVIDRIVELGLNNIKYKLDNELLNLVCNLIEHLVKKKDKISKKDLVMLIYQEIFSISTEEQLIIFNNIEYLFNNGNIRKVSTYKLFKTCFSEWTKKK